MPIYTTAAQRKFIEDNKDTMRPFDIARKIGKTYYCVYSHIKGLVKLENIKVNTYKYVRTKDGRIDLSKREQNKEPKKNLKMPPKKYFDHADFKGI